MTTRELQGSAFQHPSSPDSSITVASSMAWVPLDSVAEKWADFGAQARLAPAFVATGVAFLALSWEASALRHYSLAQQAHWHDPVLRWLGETVQDLNEALQHWSRVVLWLERLANHEQQDPEVRPLFTHVMEQQQRLWMLAQQVQAEQMTCEQDHGKVDAVTVVMGVQR